MAERCSIITETDLTSKHVVIVADCDHQSIDIEKAVLADVCPDLPWLNCRTEDEVIAQCAEAANARFGRSYAFFDAVMSADAEVTRWLHTGEGDVQRLACAYNDAMRGLTRSRRELDSVIAQLRILAGLLRCRVKSLAGDASAPDARRIQVLDELIVTLGEEIPPPRDGDPGAPTNGASPATTPGCTRGWRRKGSPFPPTTMSRGRWPLAGRWGSPPPSSSSRMGSW